jgi:hypothetical protein
LAEVDEIHVPKKETVGQAVTLRYLRSELNRSGLSVSRPGTNYSKGGGAAAAAATMGLIQLITHPCPTCPKKKFKKWRRVGHSAFLILN